MINVGCKYGPNDLEPSTWDHLIVLASERAFVDRILDRRRDRNKRDEAGVNRARQQGGLPLPGQTIFPTSKPFKGSTR
jgi:hypothetical protein